MKNNKRQLTKKQRIALNCSIIGTIVAAIIVGYACLINFYLLDFDNMSYIEFSYLFDDLNPNKEKTIRIDKVYPDSGYPSDFRIPNKLLGYRVTEIGDSAFSSLDKLTSVTFPNSITSIGEKAFYNCVKLDSFNIPNDLSSIGTEAFEGTSYLNKQADGEILIGHILYEYKGELKANTAVVEDENSQAYISKKYDNYILLNNYIQIGSGAFKNKANLVYVECPSRFTYIPDKIYYGCNNLNEVVLKEGITEIGEYAFDGCTSLNKINFPSSIKTISRYAFQGVTFSGEVVLPESLKSVEEGAFRSMSNVTKFTIPSSIDYISDYLFDSCTSLTDIIFEGENNSEGSIYYIGSYSFANTNLQSFKMPYGVISIKENTFANCANLETVYLYDNVDTTYAPNKNNPNGGSQGIKTISKNAFINNVKLDSIVLLDKDGNETTPMHEVSFPSSTISSIGEPTGESNIMMNTAMTVLNIPTSISWLPSTFAKNCLSLTTINFPAKAKITRLGLGVFSGCSALTDVTVPEYIASIDAEAFANCTSLVNLDISKTTIKTLSTKTLSNNKSIKNFVIPSTVKSIKSLAFENCSALEYVIIPESVTNCDANVFPGCKSDFKIFLGENTNDKDYYPGWDSGFKVYYYSETAPTDPEHSYWHYVDNVPTAW